MSFSSDIFKFILYADDSTLLTSFPENTHPDYMASLINEGLNAVNKWLYYNSLSLNVDKTKYMVFSHRNKTNETLTLKINNMPIQKIEYFNFLGITIHQNLTWHLHTNKLINKLSQTLGVLNQFKHFLPPYVLRTLYNSLVQPHLSYGILTII